MEYVAIDFETANRYRESACSVGLAKFRDGVLVDTFYTLLKPPAPFDHFDFFNIGIHGIEPRDVAKAKTLGQTWPEISAFIGGLPLIAHNAAFDLSVLRRQLDHEGVQFEPITFTCTLQLSKYLLDLPVLKLPYVVESLELEFGEHHNALDDALGAGMIFGHLLAGASSADELLSKARLSWGAIQPGLYVGSQHARTYTGSTSVHHTEEEIQQFRNERGLGPIDVTAPLYGKTVSFTGELNSFKREDARFAVEIEGGNWVDKPNKETDYLVLGKTDLRQIKPGQEVTAKMAKAISLREKGSSIEIIDESSFLELLTPLE